MEEERHPASCRDKGWSGVDEGALCLSWWQHDASGFREANRSHPTQDKHKAPSSTPLHPLSLQDAGCLSSSIRLSKFIRSYLYDIVVQPTMLNCVPSDIQAKRVGVPPFSEPKKSVTVPGWPEV